jgi:hypothetical protein
VNHAIGVGRYRRHQSFTFAESLTFTGFVNSSRLYKLVGVVHGVLDLTI